MKFGKATQNEAHELIRHFARYGYVFGPETMPTFCEAIKLAKNYNSIEVRHCNQHKLKNDAGRLANIEKRIKELMKPLNLTPTFDGDPRGYMVKLHTPNRDVYNTMGGKCGGYGIGENF